MLNNFSIKNMTDTFKTQIDIPACLLAWQSALHHKSLDMLRLVYDEQAIIKDELSPNIINHLESIKNIFLIFFTKLQVLSLQSS